VTDILSSADLAELRRDWVLDSIDERPEWGLAPKIKTSAAIGAATLALKALGSGTIKKDTQIIVTTASVPQSLTVTADATIAAGEATISVTPLLQRAVVADDLITVESETRSVFNRVFGRLMFSDVTIQDLARRAEERWGGRISDSPDPRRCRFAAIALLAIDEKLISTDYEAAVLRLQAADSGRGHFDRLESLRKRYESEIGFKSTGPAQGSLTR
jgi:hypothetical protein